VTLLGAVCPNTAGLLVCWIVKLVRSANKYCWGFEKIKITNTEKLLGVTELQTSQVEGRLHFKERTRFC
jgi:hypothetical protein